MFIISADRRYSYEQLEFVRCIGHGSCGEVRSRHLPSTSKANALHRKFSHQSFTHHITSTTTAHLCTSHVYPAAQPPERSSYHPHTNHVTFHLQRANQVNEMRWRGNRVAVKKIFRGILDKDTKQEFIRESEMLRRLRHPQIVLFMGTCQHGESTIYNEEISEGVCLQRVMVMTSSQRGRR